MKITAGKLHGQIQQKTPLISQLILAIQLSCDIIITASFTIIITKEKSSTTDINSFRKLTFSCLGAMLPTYRNTYIQTKRFYRLL